MNGAPDPRPGCVQDRKMRTHEEPRFALRLRWIGPPLIPRAGSAIQSPAHWQRREASTAAAILRRRLNLDPAHRRNAPADIVGPVDVALPHRHAVRERTAF